MPFEATLYITSDRQLPGEANPTGVTLVRY